VTRGAINQKLHETLDKRTRKYSAPKVNYLESDSLAMLTNVSGLQRALGNVQCALDGSAFFLNFIL
jgi:hypothetical protein